VIADIAKSSTEFRGHKVEWELTKETGDLHDMLMVCPDRKFGAHCNGVISCNEAFAHDDQRSLCRPIELNCANPSCFKGR
jgi:hypothetical protein